jgi:hypothetical protein
MKSHRTSGRALTLLPKAVTPTLDARDPPFNYSPGTQQPSRNGRLDMAISAAGRADRS